jgi:hypothetical protein
MVIRFASFRIAESMVGSKAIGNINNFWPMEGEREQEKKQIEPMTAERYQAIIQRHNLKIK